MKMEGMKAYILNLGEGSADANLFKANTTIASVFDRNPELPWITNCFMAVLIQHPEAGWILYDTGWPEDEDIPQWMKAIIDFSIGEDNSLEKQLTLVGVKPDDIRHVILSHMHIDHAGRLGLFPHASVYVDREEAEAAFTTVLGTADVAARGFYHKESLLSEVEKIEYLDEDTELFKGIHTVRLKGHTAGTTGLILELESGNYLVSSDAIALRANYDGIPTSLMVDSAAYAQSVKKAHRLANQYEVKEIWFSHDLEEFKKLRHAPEFYI